ncbi:MAG: YebC/PmpR family DNA-binding transcriptional regulator [Clostridia bacterium]|nr:YebC/PmpR family DNA-binding transcriptional regulator [Clostridia bacterium]
MSGHSKFANIKHKKEKNDSARAKVFSRISKEIAIAVKEGGSGDPNSNSKLRDVIAKAKANNVPNDNIERTIKKAVGGAGESYEEITYEGYGPGGVAVIVETTTDNRNRTAGNVRSTFSKYHGNMGTTGSVSFLFEEKGQIVINDQEDEEIDEDELMMAALDAGAADFAAEDHIFEIYTETSDVIAVADALKGAGYKIDSADRAMIPTTYVAIEDEENAKFMNLLIEKLEEDDDVMNVWTNWENPPVEEED